MGTHYVIQGWYLAVDFQLFLITPFFLYAYTKNKKLGWLITFLLFVASVVTAFSRAKMGDSIRQERQVASKMLQKISEMTVYMAEEVCQNCYIRAEKHPLIMTIK